MGTNALGSDFIQMESLRECGGRQIVKALLRSLPV